MPANRSRTLEWRRCLHQVQERNGALEIAISRDESGEGTDAEGRARLAPGKHLVWRVRLLGLTDSEIIVEQPSALGHFIEINQGIELIAILAIGQNRWMFTTTNLGAVNFALVDRKTVPALRLVMPDSVERCQRRNYYRVETATLSLPEVEIWPLLDPKSVMIAERAYEIQAEIDNNQAAAGNGPGTTFGESAAAASAGSDLISSVGRPAPKFDYEAIMPEVGPRFTATLLNLGGGGVGLRIKPEDGQTLVRHKVFWMRIALPPSLNTPICATGKLVHTHMESSHDTYAGLAFDFTFNPSHQRFVVDQICRYIAVQQRLQLQRYATQEPQRRSA